jgi:hypothetical protein
MNVNICSYNINFEIFIKQKKKNCCLLDYNVIIIIVIIRLGLSDSLMLHQSEMKSRNMKHVTWEVLYICEKLRTSSYVLAYNKVNAQLIVINFLDMILGEEDEI